MCECHIKGDMDADKENTTIPPTAMSCFPSTSDSSDLPTKTVNAADLKQVKYHGRWKAGSQNVFKVSMRVGDNATFVFSGE